MNNLKSSAPVILAVLFLPGLLSGTVIREVLVPPSTPGNAFSGTFFITPSVDTWAFGVGNPAINDTTISGVSSVNGLDASDHWISALISRNDWDSGFNFDSIRPIGATAPSSFSIITSAANWEWGSSDYVAFYWLSEQDTVPANGTAVLLPGTEYDAFRFFTSGPASPFAAYSAPNGGAVIRGETIVEGDPNEIPEPATVFLVGLGLLGMAWRRRNKQ